MRRRPLALPLCLSLALSLGLGLGCRGGEAGELRGAVQLAATEQGEIAQRALERIVPRGREALPLIEAALHGAPPPGRRNLVMALRRIGLGEAAPLLGQLAAFDEDPGVRMEARWTLRGWIARGGPLGAAAAAALRKADEAQGSEAEG